MESSVPWYSWPLAAFFVSLGGVSLLRPSYVYGLAERMHRPMPKWARYITGWLFIEKLPRTVSLLLLRGFGLFLLMIGIFVVLIGIGRGDLVTWFFWDFLDPLFES